MEQLIPSLIGTSSLEPSKEILQERISQNAAAELHQASLQLQLAAGKPKVREATLGPKGRRFDFLDQHE